LGRAAQQFAYANSSVNKTQYVYRYDPRGRLVAVHDSTVFPTNTCGDDADFGVRLCAGYTALLQWKDSLAYDRLGNAAYANGSTGVGSASYDKNRITSWPGYTYASDAEGNVTQRAKVGGATTNFYWSADGLLDSVVVGARKIRYDYNAFGQLVRKRVDGASGETRHFFWDQGHLLAELDATLSSRVAEYAYYPGTDSPMAVVTGATTVTATRYVQQDLQGSVIGLTTSSGTVDNAVIVSRPWGEYVFWSNGGGPGLDTLRLRWKGLFYEGDSTQLYYVRARWYDPVTHRFLTQDPIGLEGGTNPYTFAGNDPVNAGDPDGLRVECTTTYIYYTHIELPEVNVSCTQTAGAGGSGFFFPPRPGGSGPWGTGGGNDGLALTPGGWGGGQSSPARPRSGAEKGLDVLGACIAEDLGLSAILAWAGVTANAWGAGTMAKGIRAGAPSARTSLAATVARDALYGRRFPKGFKMPSPTFASLKTVKYASPKVGKVLGRAVPGVGWAIWAYDAYRIGSCVIKESN